MGQKKKRRKTGPKTKKQANKTKRSKKKKLGKNQDRSGEEFAERAPSPPTPSTTVESKNSKETTSSVRPYCASLGLRRRVPFLSAIAGTPGIYLLFVVCWFVCFFGFSLPCRHFRGRPISFTAALSDEGHRERARGKKMDPL